MHHMAQEGLYFLFLLLSLTPYECFCEKEVKKDLLGPLQSNHVDVSHIGKVIE